MRNILKQVIRTLKRDGYDIKGYKKIDIEEIEHSPDYYEMTRNLKENLHKFEEEIKALKEQYKKYSFEYAFQEEFGEELSPEDFQYQERIDAYCERNKVSPERLHELKRERLKLREKVNNEIFHRVTLAKSILLIRDGNCPDYMLSKAARLEKIYGSPDKAAEYQEMLDKVRRDKTKIKEGVRWDILNYTSDMIIVNTDPYNGKEPEFQENWTKGIDLVEKKLQAKGITIEEFGHNQEIREIWTEVNNQMKQERNERVTLEQFCNRAQKSALSVQASRQEITEKVPQEQEVRRSDR
ncbi:MAG: hypothetical protein ACOX2N_08370 [Peptococcia bacterium]|jgi:hypothetical protein